MTLLHPGDPFPELSLTVPGGATVKVPETFDGQFGAMLFYGLIVPLLQRRAARLPARQRRPGRCGRSVAALSVDDEATTASLIARHGLAFPVGFGADARDRGPDRRLRQPGPGVPPVHRLRPRPAGQSRRQSLLQRAIGHLVPEDVAGLVRYLHEHAATSA